jgi:hypothetical protein
MENMLYRLLLRANPLETCLHVASLSTSFQRDECQSLQVWHNRLCHINNETIKKMVTTNIIDGIQITTTDGDHFCEACAQGKQHRNSFPHNPIRLRASKSGQLIHVDLCGPMSTQSIGGTYYFAVFKDDCTCYRIVHCLAYKSDVNKSIQQVVLQVKRETSQAVEIIRSNRGKEFTNNEIIKFYQDNGIKQELSAPYCPEQNGVTEHDNHTIAEAACTMFHARTMFHTRTMFHARNVRLRFWGEAVQTATYILNRTYTRLLPHTTSYQAWFGVKPLLAHTRIFGCDAFIYVPKALRKKLNSKSHRGMFLGYFDESKAYRIWDKDSKRIATIRNVLFHENTKTHASQDTTATYFTLPPPDLAPTMTMATVPPSTVATSTHISQPTIPNSVEASSINPGNNVVLPPCTRPKYTRRPVSFYGDWASLATMISLEHVEPKTYKEAISGVDYEHWNQAMTEEITSLQENGTWELTTLNTHYSAVACKWTYRLKFNPDGSFARYKARLVTTGFSQRHGVDFFDTYSPVVKADSIQAILSIAAVEDLEIRQFDNVTTFFNGSLSKKSSWINLQASLILNLLTKFAIYSNHYTDSAKPIAYGIQPSKIS